MVRIAAMTGICLALGLCLRIAPANRLPASANPSAASANRLLAIADPPTAFANQWEASASWLAASSKQSSTSANRLAVFADQPAASSPIELALGGFQALGSVGCSATACHGQPDAKALTQPLAADCWKASATIFLAADPHRGAYRTLLSPLSQKIAQNLGTALPAHEDIRCLVCHTNPTLAQPATELKPAEISLRTEGVSCEACHGNAERWQGDHVSWSNNPARRQAACEKLGFVDLNQQSTRALVCARCHLGHGELQGHREILGHGKLPSTPPFDMNHDMIAAGHPRLEFDYISLLARLPQHWQERDRNQAMPEAAGDLAQQIQDRLMLDRLMLAWQEGERAALLARLSLLESRARRAADRDQRTPWPELSEYNCESCHRPITPDRRSPFAARFPPGIVTWSMSANRQLQSLHDLMNLRVSPRPAEIEGLIRKIQADQSNHELGSYPTLAARIQTLAAMTHEELTALTWSEAAQAYHALAAADFLTRKQQNSSLDEDSEFDRLKAMLLSPSDYDADKAAAAIRHLATRLATAMANRASEANMPATANKTDEP